MIEIDAKKKIGPSFTDDLKRKGLLDKHMSWGGEIVYYCPIEDHPQGFTTAEVLSLQAVIASHDSEAPAAPDDVLLKQMNVVATADKLERATIDSDSPEYETMLSDIRELGEGIK